MTLSDANAVNNGWKWLVLTSCLGTKVFNIGLRKSFGVLLTTLHVQLDIPVWLLGTIVSIAVSTGDFIGIVLSLHEKIIPEHQIENLVSL